MSLIRKHVAVLQAWACLALVDKGILNLILYIKSRSSYILYFWHKLMMKILMSCERN